MRAEPLGHHAQFIRGITFKPTEKCAVGTKDSLVCLRTANVQQTLDEEDLIAVPASIVKNPEKIVRIGDILVSSANSWNLVGKCCRVESLRYPSTAGGFISILRADPSRLDAAYLYRWFSSNRTQATVRSFGNQTTNISNLDHTRTLSLPIPVPPLPAQKRIAAILDAADALRAKRQASVEQLDSLVQATFLEMFGDPVTNPKGWQSKRIEDFCKTQTGGTPSRSKASLYYGGSIPWVKSGELREQTIYDTEEHITPKALEESAAKMVPKGALMVALYGATVGRIARLGIEAATNQAICSIIVPTNQASPAYMFQALREKVPEWLSRRVGGGQPNISNGVIKDTLIPLPPLPLQTRFASIVESIEQQKARLKAHLAELDMLFASLQSRAFNGELVA